METNNQIIPLNGKATRQDIVGNLNLFKIHALNYATKTISDKNAQFLEPKDVKTLTDLVLNLEDSVRQEVPEGQQAKTIHRLLERYGN